MDITSTLMNDMVDRWKDIPQVVNGEGQQKAKENENKNEGIDDKPKEDSKEPQVLNENGSKGLATVKLPSEPKELQANVDPSPGTRHSRTQSPMNESPTSEQA
ncbi:BA75_01884T0 [Komagataella pastoris]|uniref:BA75_01884T0 n=1 Tax=Komagataella pastoris TaxID=4922 RepID=A0A1B2JCE3_PICPA|nr:BA75_01884T0 [Komagataella pastoris]